MTGNTRGRALITGASSGIGRAFARGFARRGIDLVILARRREKLEGLATDLRDQHGIDVIVWDGDLADPETPERLLRSLEAQGAKIDVLVNNAGFGVPGELVDVEWSRHRDCLQVMASAPVRLVHLFAPAMIERRRGSIINVASLSALLPPHAGGTLYYPVKSFMMQFSLAMREELRPHGITVSAVCPGFTETGFQQAAGGTVESVAFPKALWSSPDDVAEAAIAAAKRNKAICVPGMVNKVIAAFFKLIPGPIGRRIVR